MLFYNFIIDTSGEKPSQDTKWSGTPYLKQDYGFGYSLASTTVNDLAISSPSDQLSNNVGVGQVQIFNNRMQLSLYARGSTLLDGKSGKNNITKIIM